MYDLFTLGKRAKNASLSLKISSGTLRNNALRAIADGILESYDAIIEANKLDILNAKTAGMRESMIDRLTLTSERLDSIVDALIQLVGQADPIGVVDKGIRHPNGMQIIKTRVPLGVLAVIFESRPNVTVDAAALAVKSGNACILRGGSEAFSTNKTLVGIMQNALEKAGLDRYSVQLVEDTSRDTATRLMKLQGYIDVLIPRGGAGLIKSVVENATVPTIETGAGNCHLYVDKFANLEMADKITHNAKCQRPSVCNSIETVLVHKDIAEEFLPMIEESLKSHKVELRGCANTLRIINSAPLATEDDYYTEFNDYILAVKVVSDIYEAIAHIEKYSTGHSEAIITDNYENANIFTSMVDSAAVYVNASTRFTDGGEMGLGAEVGISTQKLHARGPMGLSELTTSKYIISGNGQIR